IPLVVADQGSDAAGGSIEDADARVARTEVMLLMIEDVLGDMCLAIAAQQCPVLLEDGRRVEESTVPGPLKDRSADQDDAILLRRSCEDLGGWSRDRLRKVEGGAVIGNLAKVRSEEQFRQDDQFRPAFRCLADELECPRQVLFA